MRVFGSGSGSGGDGGWRPIFSPERESSKFNVGWGLLLFLLSCLGLVCVGYAYFWIVVGLLRTIGVI